MGVSGGLVWFEREIFDRSAVGVKRNELNKRHYRAINNNKKSIDRPEWRSGFRQVRTAGS